MRDLDAAGARALIEALRDDDPGPRGRPGSHDRAAPRPRARRRPGARAGLRPPDRRRLVPARHARDHRGHPVGDPGGAPARPDRAGAAPRSSCSAAGPSRPRRRSAGAWSTAPSRRMPSTGRSRAGSIGSSRFRPTRSGSRRPCSRAGVAWTWTRPSRSRWTCSPAPMRPASRVARCRPSSSADPWTARPPLSVLVGRPGAELHPVPAGALGRPVHRGPRRRRDQDRAPGRHALGAQLGRQRPLPERRQRLLPVHAPQPAEPDARPEAPGRPRHRAAPRRGRRRPGPELPARA